MSKQKKLRQECPPVLFLLYNRPNFTERVFAEIRKARPGKLYVACDGPRKNSDPIEVERIHKTRAIVMENIDWDCEAETLFRTDNLGCRASVSGAVDWFFENEEEGIVLEDDCLPSQDFFSFCQELLELYRYDERVMCLTGSNFQRGLKRGRYSYYFSQIPHCWGWATWRRAWEKMTPALNSFEVLMNDPSLRKFTSNQNADHMWRKMFNRAYYREIDSWAYLWTFANFINHGLTVSPNKNLIENVGFGGDSTHTKKTHQYVSVERDTLSFPLTHPPYVCLDRDADNFDYRHHFNLHPFFYWPLSFLSEVKRYFQKVKKH